MNTTSFYKAVFFKTFMIASLVAGSAISVVHADYDKESKPEAHSDGVGTAIDDAAITTKIRKILMSESEFKNSNINITTTNGVVTLDGMVSDSKAKSLAEDKAESIDGVKSVDNNLTTPDSNKSVDKTKEAVSDSWITTKVKSDLLADNMAKGFNVSVETTDGVVALKGFLANQDAVDHVKDVASKVKGVKGVDVSNLVVEKK